MMTIEDFTNCDLRDLLGKLNDDEKISLLAGPDWWTTNSIPRLGVPAIKCSDGPNGVRGSSHFLPTPANCIPCETALGATFDVELVHEIGGLLAADAKAKGSSLLLAPTINIQRNPLNGRAFESFSEDPHLSGTIAGSYVNGLQQGGVGAVIKHFVCNDQEHERFSVSAEVQERPLREIYLYPFMLAQKAAKPWGVMTAYGRLNGIHCSEDKRLLQDILRDEWKFDGLVMSDWTGTYSTDIAIKAGLDLEMPGPTRFRGIQVKHLLNAKKISIRDLDARAYAILQVVQRSCQADLANVKNNRDEEKANDTPANRALNRKAAANAIVLLKNTSGTLPLDRKKLKKIAIVGPNAKTRTVSGGGSAYLMTGYVSTPWEALKSACEAEGTEVNYAPGCYGHRYLPMLDGWIKAEDGSNGWTARFYNEDFDAKADAVATMVLPGTRMRINDTKPKGLADEFWVGISGYVTAEVTGPFEFGIALIGQAQVLVDGKIIIDNGVTTQQKRDPGSSFYGLGTVEEKGVVEFVQGKTYHLTIRYSNRKSPFPDPDMEKSGQPALVMAGLRVGGAPKLAGDEAAIAEAVKLAQESDAVLCFTGGNMDWEAEGSDRVGLALPGLTDRLVSALLEVKPDTVICNQSGSAFAFPWADKATTIMQSWFGGSETGNAIADVVFGDVNPSGRLPLTFPKRIEDCSAYLNWQAENGKVLYGEGLFVGYRGYDALLTEPAFAFGAGLSYTSFEWSGLETNLQGSDSADSLKVTVSLDVKNTGKLAGADIVQIYVVDKVSSLRRPHKELKGFVKVYLKAGESKQVEIVLEKYAFSFYDDLSDSWVAEKGTFELRACKSSSANDLVSSVEVELPNTLHWKGV